LVLLSKVDVVGSVGSEEAGIMVLGREGRVRVKVGVGEGGVVGRRRRVVVLISTNVLLRVTVG